MSKSIYSAVPLDVDSGDVDVVDPDEIPLARSRLIVSVIGIKIAIIVSITIIIILIMAIIPIKEIEKFGNLENIKNLIDNFGLENNNNNDNNDNDENNNNNIIPNANACIPSFESMDAGYWDSCSSVIPSNNSLHFRRWLHQCSSDGSEFSRFSPQLNNFFHETSSFCGLAPFSPRDMRRLFSNRRLLFVGDSTTQELVTELVSYMEESPHAYDFAMESWIHQLPCGGLSLAYQARTIISEQFPTPALSIFNISVHFVWDGHENECQNSGHLPHFRNSRFRRKLSTHSNICMNRTAHLNKLAELLDANNLFHTLNENDSLEQRENLFQQLQQSRNPVSGDYPINLHQASAAAHRDPKREFIDSMLEQCDKNYFNTDAQKFDYFIDIIDSSESVRPPRLNSFDYSSVGIGAHTFETFDWSRSTKAPNNFVDEFRTIVTETFEIIRAMTTKTIVWRDVTPIHIYPHVHQLNAVMHQYIEEMKHEPNTANARVLPLQYLLASLVKEDNRHCSFKDLRSSEFSDRNREIRTPWCHQAVQILIHAILLKN